MNRWTKGTLAALAALSIAVVGCQDQGAGESLDTLPSDGAMESMGMESMGTESMDDMMSDDASDDADESDDADASDDGA